MDAVDYLDERARLIGHANRDMPDGLLWRWHRYDWHTPLRGALRNYDTLVDFRRPGDSVAALYLDHLHVKDALRDERVEEIPVGAVKLEDGVTIEAHNFCGLAELPVHYDAKFSHATSREKALEWGLKVTTTVGVEVEKAVKVSASLSIEASVGGTSTHGTQDAQERSGGIDPVCPPGCDITFRMQRQTQPTKLKVSGWADLEHSVTIGKHAHGRWQNHEGDGRSLHWDTFADFLKTIKGDGHRNHRATAWFKTHPPPQWLVERLEAPLSIRYDAETAAFDGWTKLIPRQTVVRGPNPDVLAKLRALHAPSDTD